MERLRIATVLPADPASIYDAWISGKGHAEMTGAKATSEAKKGGAFTAWDGYISGTHLVLERGKRIVQAWRTTEFPTAAPDSTVEIRFSEVTRGTRLALLQSDIPDGQSDMYAEGWVEYYFDPMARYFKEQAKAPPAKKTAKRKGPAKKTAKRKGPAKKTLTRARPKSARPARKKKAPAAARTARKGRSAARSKKKTK